ncbi:unnamed protein product [Symbiodinium sp. CCMP2592]|nr:unnamed protein product [Symbiodinium sp. CCMP2592]
MVFGPAPVATCFWLQELLLASQADAVREAASAKDFEPQMASQPTHSPSLSDQGCHNRVCWQNAERKSLGQFGFRVPEGFFLPHPSRHHALLGDGVESCDAGHATVLDAWVTLWLDELDPVHNSSIFVYLDPLAVARHQQLKHRGVICSSPQATESSRCLCRLQFEKWEWNLFDVLHKPLAAMERADADRQMERKVLKVQAQCPAKFSNMLAVFAVIFSSLLLVLLLYMGYVAVQMAQLGLQQWHENAGVSADETALVVPDAISHFKDGAMQILRLSTLMMSLQWTILDHIKKEADLTIMAFVALWPLFFGIFGILRSIQSLCQRQLAHAALSHGVCLTGSRPLNIYDGLTGIGMLLLACCVAVGLGKAGLFATCALVVALFSGPALSIVGELQQARAADQGVIAMLGGHRMPGLLKLFHRVRAPAGDGKPTQTGPILEEKLVHGEVRLLPFSAVVAAGRASQDIMEALREEPASQAGPGFNVLRDWHWHGAAVYTMSRSHAGFLILPLLLLPTLAMLGSAFFQAMVFLCDVPELSQLGLAYPEHGLEFRPWMHHYSVPLDASFKEAFVVASAEASSTTSLEICSTAGCNKSRVAAIFGTVELLNMPLPHVARVRQRGLQEKMADYNVAFVPLTTLATRITIAVESTGFERNLSWSEVPGAVLSLQAEKTSNLSINIYLTDYELGVPQPCQRNQWNGSDSVHGVLTEFCPFNSQMPCGDESDDRETCCREHCRHDPFCLVANAGTAGCFRAHMAATELQPVEGRQWLNRSISGQICNLKDAEGQQCAKATADSMHVLRFRNLQPDWLNSQARLKLALALASGQQQVFNQAEDMQVRRATPEVLEVLVNLTSQSRNSQPELESTDGTEAIMTYLTAEARINEEQDVEVTIMPFEPHAVDQLVLYLAVLLKDGGEFQTEWTGTEAEQANQAEVTFQQCDGSLFLQHRFEICRRARGFAGGWAASVIKVVVPAWSPEDVQLTFQIHPKDPAKWGAIPGEEKAATHRVKINLHDADSVGLWAIAPDSDSEERCRFLADPADVASTNASGLHPVSLYDVEHTLLLDPKQFPILAAVVQGAACTYVHRKCARVHSMAFGSVLLEPLVHQFYLRQCILDQLGSLHRSLDSWTARRQNAPILWRFLRCSAQAEGFHSVAKRCAACQVGTPSERHHYSDILCCKCNVQSPGGYSKWGLEASELFGILPPQPDETDASLVNLTCSTLPYNASKAEFEENMLRAAVETSNLQAVKLALMYCASNVSAKDAAQLWRLLRVGLDVVGLVWDDFPNLVGPLLQAALDDDCEPCLAAVHSNLQRREHCLRTDWQHKNMSLQFTAAPHYTQGFQLDQLIPDDIASSNGLLSRLVTEPCIRSRLVDLSLQFPEGMSNNSDKQIAATFNLLPSQVASLQIAHLGFPSLRLEDEVLLALCQLPKLRSLMLDDTYLSYAAVTRLGQMLANSTWPELTELVLGQNTAGFGFFEGPSFAVKLVPALGSLPTCHVRKFSIQEGCRGEVEADLMSIFHGLAHCKGLTHVNICQSEYCNISRETRLEVQQALPQWPSLQDLRFCDCTFRDDYFHCMNDMIGFDDEDEDEDWDEDEDEDLEDETVASTTIYNN